MWSRPSRAFSPKQVDGIAGQADAVHPVFQAVLVQTHQRMACFTGQGLHPGDARKPSIRLCGEDRLGPVHRHPKGAIQHRRMVGAHRLPPAEHPGGAAAALSPCAALDVGVRLLGADAGARQGKAGNDGMGDAAVAADAAQDLQGLCVVILPVEGVLFQCSYSLTGRAGGAAEENGKLATNSIKVVDVLLDVEYDDIYVAEGGTKSFVSEWLSSRSLFLSFLPDREKSLGYF